MKEEPQAERSLIISYLTLRKAIGFLGVALPFVVSLGAFIFFRTGLQGSISSYYYTGMRNVFVGIFWAIGIFLISYRGYGLADAIAGILGCIFAVGITLFPTTPDYNPSVRDQMIGHFHLIFAALFFIVLIVFSMYLFTKTAEDKKKHPVTGRKRQRNLVYTVCGAVMAACMLLIGIYQFLPPSAALLFKAYDPIFWLETIAIISFGISWMIKGETLLKDKAERGRNYRSRIWRIDLH
jgi:hypothetical protein